MSARPPTTAADRLVGLDTLRTIAIVHVVLAHGAMTFMPALPGVGGRVVWWLIAANFGVPLFFVLSGFLITRQLASGMPTGTFYRHRLAKIYPTFALAVVVFGLIAGVTDLKAWLLHLTALHNLAYSMSGRMSGHLWSLAVELQFYALAPLLFALGYRRLSVPRMAALVVLVWAAHAWLLVGATPPVQAARLAALLNIYQYTSFNIVALLLGALLYKAYATGARWPGAAALGLAAALGMPAICAMVLPSLQVNRADLTRNGDALALLLLICLPPIASVCLGHLTLQRQWFTGPVWRRWSAFFAAISYQWYLWHPLVLLGFHRAATRWAEVDAWVRASPWLALAAYGALSASLAWLAYRFVEQPLHARLRASLGGSRQLPGAKA